MQLITCTAASQAAFRYHALKAGQELIVTRESAGFVFALAPKADHAGKVELKISKGNGKLCSFGAETRFDVAGIHELEFEPA